MDRTGWVTYWAEEKRKSVEGNWVEELPGEWRWMNPDLYFYINHWWMLHKGEQGSEVAMKPYLRDTEWYVLSHWTCCRGFSGFSEGEFNGHYLLKKYYDNKRGDKDEYGTLVELSKAETRQLAKSKWVLDENGKYKKYKDPYEILIDTYDRQQGVHLYDNAPEDMMLFSSRSLGKSLIASSIIGREYTFDGARYSSSNVVRNFNATKLRTVGKAFCGSEEEKHVNLIYSKVFYGLDNFEGGYTTVDKKYPPPFYKQRSGTFSNSNEITHKYNVYYKVGGKNSKGSNSTMYKGLYGSNINQAIGNRLNIMIIDEAGLIHDLPLVHNANKTSMEKGGEKTGSMLYIGTGGDIKRIAGSKALFYNPKQNKLRVFKNLWEEGKNICMFIPAEYALNDFKDNNGNTILDQARDEILKRRRDVAMGTDMTALDGERMYMPMKPSDMFLMTGDLIYNQARIMERLSYLERTDDWRTGTRFGQIINLGNHADDIQIKRGSIDTERPILKRDISGLLNKKGCIIFYTEPESKGQFRIKGSRFRITYDPYRKDGDGPSLASILVWDTQSDNLAAEYIGRRNTPEEVHDICLNLGVYFNAPILHETNVVGFTNRAKSRGLSYLLYPTPIKALSKKVSNIKYTQGQVGVEMSNKFIKNAAIQYSQTFLYKRDDEGMDVYDKVQSLRLLEEMEIWDGDINSDHISAFLLLSLWEEEEREVVPIEKSNVEDEYQKFRNVLMAEKQRRNLQRLVYS